MPPLTTRLTPFTAVPRRLPLVGSRRRGQRIANLVIFALAPSLLFWWWYATAVVSYLPADADTLRWAIPVAAMWITIGPLLMQQGDMILEAVLAAFNRHGSAAGWDLPAMQRRLRLLDRLYYPLVIPIGLSPPLALALSFRPLAEIIPVSSVGHRLSGLLVIGVVGLCSASGIWGVTKAVALTHAATATARLAWHPFRVERAWGIQQLYVFAWTAGLLFSCGALFVPAMLGVQPYLTPASSAIVWVFVVLLLLGGLTVFSVPVLLLYRVASAGKRELLDRIAPAIEDLARPLVAGPGPAPGVAAVGRDELARLATTLQLRRAIEAVDAAPFSLGFVARAATTLILPVLLTMVQIIGER